MDMPASDRAERRRNVEAILDSPSYLLAEQDMALLARRELRPVRLQLELLKPELTLEERNITSTIVVFGSTRIAERSELEARLQQARSVLAGDPNSQRAAREVARAESLLQKVHYYDAAREFTRLVSSRAQADARQYVIVTGGGPGIMEAANRGAYDVGAPSIGLNITLSAEQIPNPYITPELCFQFHYFALRKLHFLLRAQALVVFPGGFGTHRRTVRRAHAPADAPHARDSHHSVRPRLLGTGHRLSIHGRPGGDRG